MPFLRTAFDEERTKHGVARAFFFALAVLLAAAFFLPAPVRSAEYLTVSGCSISNVGYLTELAREYERRTGMKVFVRGGGSMVGIEDLRNGTVDLAAACRSRDADDPADVTFVQVAWDALVFIVHKSNPVNSITLAQVREIYAGRIANWRRLGGPDAPVKVFISRTKSGLSGVEASTDALVLRGRKPARTRYTSFVASTAIVEQMVEETPEAFAATGITSARKRNVKILRVGGVAPTRRAILRGRYPLRRPLYLLLPKNPRPEVKEFVDFVLSAEGQRFIDSLGVISLRDMK